MRRPVFYGFAIIKPDGNAMAAVFRSREAAVARARGFVLAGSGHALKQSETETDWQKLRKRGFSIEKIEVWTSGAIDLPSEDAA